MKVIVANYPKTGTKSIAQALSLLGYKTYDFMEHWWYHGDQWMKILNGNAPPEIFLEMYKDVDAVLDAPAFFFWEEIYKMFPDAKVSNLCILCMVIFCKRLCALNKIKTKLFIFISFIKACNKCVLHTFTILHIDIGTTQPLVSLSAVANLSHVACLGTIHKPLHLSNRNNSYGTLQLYMHLNIYMIKQCFSTRHTSQVLY